MGKSLAQIVASLNPREREEVLAGLDHEKLAWDWSFWGRPEQFVPEGHFIHMICQGRGAGKLLRLETPMLKADGTWTTMGELHTGDVILDETGSPTKVVMAHQPYVPHKMYRLYFSDGTWLDADADHQWVTWVHRDRKAYMRGGNDCTVGLPDDWPTWTNYRYGKSTGVGPKIRLTQDIVDTFRHGVRGDLNHSIPVTLPISFSHKKLPLDPELLGVWLGGGHTNSSEISQHRDDVYHVERVASKAGFRFVSYPEKRNPNSYRVDVHGLSTALKVVGVFGNKHIPRVYLTSSVEQRKALLAGLMDTDGYINQRHSMAEYCTVLPQLAEDVMELLRSLGEKPVCVRSESYLYGVRKQDRYRITWRPKFNPFHLERKHASWSPLGAQAFKHFHRMIVDYKEIPPVMGRCLTVDSPNSLYLAGKALIPTHNTRSGAEWVRETAQKYPGCRIALVGRTTADVIGTMINGESGILAVHPPSERPEHQVSKRRLVWPNGTIAETFSSQEPSQLRGPQAFRTWADELGSWLHTADDSGLTAWDNAKFMTRLPYDDVEPQILVTTTPKRTQSIIDLFDEAEKKPDKVKIMTGSTFDNAANLSAIQLEELRDLYEGTEIGRQELDGELLRNLTGIMWTLDMLEDNRDLAPQRAFPYYIVAVDPSVSDARRDECGIIVLGVTNHPKARNRHAYVVEDLSGQMGPKEWAPVVVEAAKKYHAPVIVEKNQGGDMLPMVLQAIEPDVRVFTVWARKSKAERAEPVVAKYKSKKVHHFGHFPELENQMTTWDPQHSKKSPDRVDALCWGVYAALLTPPVGLFSGGLKARAARGRVPGRQPDDHKRVIARRQQRSYGISGIDTGLDRRRVIE